MADSRLKDVSVLKDDDATLAWAVVEPVWDLPSPDDKATALPKGWDGVTKGQRMLYALTWLEREAANGGVAQYFSNWGGIWFPYVRESAVALKLPELTSILDEMSRVFPGGKPPVSRTACVAELDRMAEAACQADPELRDYESPISVLNSSAFQAVNSRLDDWIGDGEKLYGAMALYVRANQSEFFR